jgi:hypothetical protein
MKFRWLSWLVSASLMCACLVLIPRAKADEWNKRTVVTFNAPVEIPGMVLDPGTYVMKVADLPSDRNVVEFYNANENHLYKMVMAVPAYRMTPADHTVITFEERAANSPQAIRNWFYPGDLYGEHFVYRHVNYVRATAPLPVLSPRPAEVAPLPAPVVTAPEPQAPTASVTPAPVPEQQHQTEIAKANPEPLPAPAPAPQQQQTPERQLPKTAGFVPLVGLLGGFSVMGGALLRRKRT